MAASSVGHSRHPSPQQHSPAPPGGSRVVPRPDKIYNPSSEYGVSPPGSPPSWTCLENLQREASRRHPNQMPGPPQQASFDTKEQPLNSELPPDVRAPHPTSKAEPSHPTEKTNFSRMYPRSHSFGHDPQLMTIGEDWNVDVLVN